MKKRKRFQQGMLFGKQLTIDTSIPMEKQDWFKSDLLSPDQKRQVLHTWEDAGRMLKEKIKSGEIVIINEQ